MYTKIKNTHCTVSMHLLLQQRDTKTKTAHALTKADKDLKYYLCI